MDTNAVIDYLGNKLPAKGIDFMNGVMDGAPNISVVTKIEVLGFNASAKHYKTLFNFVNDVTVLDLTNNVVDLTIEIRKSTKPNYPMLSLLLQH